MPCTDVIISSCIAWVQLNIPVTAGLHDAFKLLFLLTWRTDGLIKTRHVVELVEASGSSSSCAWLVNASDSLSAQAWRRISKMNICYCFRGQTLPAFHSGKIHPEVSAFENSTNKFINLGNGSTMIITMIFTILFIIQHLEFLTNTI